jgi:regulator of replication initiation timing
MIIVKTKNGDHFVNDSALIEVAHDKEKAIVYCHTDGCITTIVDVERVTYTTADMTVKYVDNGSRVAELEANLHELSKWGNNMRDKYMELEKENGELKAELDKLKNRIETAKDMETSNKKISLIATSLMGSDCTQAFDVENCDGMTVKDFIMQVIQKDPYVTIDIMRDGRYIWNGRYNMQALEIDNSKEIPEGMYDMKVKSARAAGGWGQMSYNVKLYDSEK